MIVYKELSSIERDLGIPAKTLYAISNNLGKHYREVKLPKKDGTYRTLSVPSEALKRVQRAIAERLLAYEPVSHYARAYRVASSIQQNAEPHVGQAKLLKLDIHRFFDSILYSTVKDRVFPPSRYAEPIRILLSMLCYYKDVLPQGAPTSPVITNIIMRDFDERVGKWCARRKIAYTRYCDDMTFSGDFDETEVKSFVEREMHTMGFYFNERKTVVAHTGTRQTVTGLVVNEKTNVPKDYKRQIRADIHYCEKFGVESHLARLGDERTPREYLNSLLGRIRYVRSICPDDESFKAYELAVRVLLRQYAK